MSLTKLQLELLGLLQEECAEVIQIVSKIRRFGLESVNPYDPTHNNRTLLEHEIGDVRLIIQLLTEKYGEKMIDEYRIQARSRWKRVKLQEHGIIPKPPTLSEFMNTPAAEALADLFEEVQADEAKERRFDDLIREVRDVELSENLSTEFEGVSRKYLLQEAAKILSQLERLQDEH